MSPEKSETILRMEKLIDASPEEVFQAWTQVDQIKKWFAPSDAFQVPQASLDPQVGGRYRIEMLSPEGTTHTVIGQYLEIKPAESIVMTWAWEGSEMEQQETRLSLEFRPEGDKTSLKLVHELFPNQETRDKHMEGWTGCLQRLQNLLQ